MKFVVKSYVLLISLFLFSAGWGRSRLWGQSPGYLVGGQLSAGFDWQDSAAGSLYHFSIQPRLGRQLATSRWYAGISPSWKIYKDEQAFFDETGWQASLHPWLRYYSGADSQRVRIFGELGAGLLYARETLSPKPAQTLDFFTDDNGILGQNSGINFFVIGSVGANYRLGGGWFLEPTLSGRIDRLLEGSRAPGGIDNFQIAVGLVYIWRENE